MAHGSNAALRDPGSHSALSVEPYETFLSLFYSDTLFMAKWLNISRKIDDTLQRLFLSVMAAKSRLDCTLRLRKVSTCRIGVEMRMRGKE